MADYDTSELRKRISELIAERLKEEQELANLEAFIDNLDPESAKLMIKMGTSSRKKADDEQSVAQVKADLEAQRGQKSDAIRGLWLKINELQEQERKQKAA